LPIDDAEFREFFASEYSRLCRFELEGRPR
jgi:hypothetical protein